MHLPSIINKYQASFLDVKMASFLFAFFMIQKMKAYQIISFE